jgi:DNA adenine methylase
MRTLRPKIRPLIKIPGGKHYMAPRIVSLFPPHKTYIEACAGGLNALLNKERSPIEFACDVNVDLIKTYLFLQTWPDELIRRLREIPYTQESFDWARQPIGKDDHAHDVAVKFLVRHRFSRVGLGRDFAWSKRQRGGQPGDANAWETFLTTQLPLISQRLQGVRFACEDCVRLYERRANNDSLSYFDPPYPHASRTAHNLYAHEMSDEDHKRLLDAILYGPGMVVISSYPNALYDNALSSWERIEIPMPNHSGQGKTKQPRTEVVWLNPACERFRLRG